MTPAGRMRCRFTEVVEGRLLGGWGRVGRCWPGYSGGSLVPTCVAFSSCWSTNHQRTNP